MRDFHKSGFLPTAVIICALYTFTTITCGGTYSGGSGTADDPYKISSVADWQELIATSADWSMNFILINDIDFGGLKLTPVGLATYSPDGWNDFSGIAFTGVFDGNNQILRQIVVDLPYEMCVGLFGYLADGGIICNLRVENIHITGYRFVGGLCGYQSYATITGCHTSGIIDSVYSGPTFVPPMLQGGLCGYNHFGNIYKCDSNVLINGGNYACHSGGLCGINYQGTISDCSAIGEVDGNVGLGGLCGGNQGTINTSSATGSVNGVRGLGGLCGSNDTTCDIHDSYSTGTVRAGDDAQYLGGLCGVNHGTIRNSCASGNIYGGVNSSYLGGLCGSNGVQYQGDGTIISCYALGSINCGDGPNSLGGLCGSNYGVVNDSYAMGDVIAGQKSYYLGGLCGVNNDNYFGYNYKSLITSCYATGKIIGGVGSYSKGGLCGENRGTIIDSYWNRDTAGTLTSAGGWVLTDAEMKQSSSYIGWSNGQWTINEGQDYPHLTWELLPGNPIMMDYPLRTYEGDGTEENPFCLRTPDDLVCLGLRRPDWANFFVVTDNIDMAGIMDYRPIQDFRGKLYGQGHVIKNLFIDSSITGNRAFIGFLGRLGNGGTISSFGLDQISIVGGDESRYLGGLCGEMSNGTISSCFSTGSINGGQSSQYLGGLCGYNYSGSVRYSYSSTSIFGNDYSKDVGGMCGENYGNINDCFAAGLVCSGISSERIGGLCGFNYYFYASISDCYATSNVTSGIRSKDLGGFCGKSSNAIIHNSFWDTQTSGLNTSSGGDGKSTVLMKTLSTFKSAGWDFTNTWAICEGTNYPRLQWQIPVTDWVCPDGVAMEDLLYLAGRWMKTGSTGAGVADVDGSGKVDLVDMAILSENWGK